MFYPIGRPIFVHSIEDPEAIATWAPKHGFATIVQLSVDDILDDVLVRFVRQITLMKVGSEPGRTCWTISSCVEFYDRFRDAGHDKSKNGQRICRDVCVRSVIADNGTAIATEK
jgi:hypothetical protein